MKMRDIINLMEAHNPEDIYNQPGFEMWFEGSKIVDDQGHPLRVYHGTTGDFDRFSDEEIPYRGGILAFFSTSSDFASSYATSNSGANVMPCYLNCQKPFDFRKDWRQAEYFWEDTGGIQDAMEINRILMGLNDPDVTDVMDVGHELTEEQFVGCVKSGSWDALEAPEFVEYLRGEGYDCIITMENNAINFGIFSQNQVKSAFSKGFDDGDDRLGETVDMESSSSSIAEGILDGDLPETLYHATFEPYLNSIIKHGLGGVAGTKNYDMSDSGVVYLAATPELAYSYAEDSLEVPEEYLEQIVVLAVYTASLDHSLIKGDRNVQVDEGEYGETVEYHGVIHDWHVI